MELPSRTLAVFAKRPVAGAVKTRLAAATSPAWAAEVAVAFLGDVLDRVAAVAARRFLAYAPADAGPFFADLAGGRFLLVPQREGDLGQRMSGFLHDQLATGGPVVLIGTDSPTLPTDFIERAFRELERADVVLGPATDGGYYLIGCTRRVPPVFEALAWGGDRVLLDTVLGLPTAYRLALLPPWYDVDTLADWTALRGHLAALRRVGVDPGVPRTETLAAQER
ncbi:MAG: TIGR04282 family arsenosugar biosynthesis glycosyltransferase [Gemmataceae bacterium]|nr:TIGR04282 family arsenosugar biosynthesis glycosyltransferase [Gemmataceae bacterium]